MLCLIAGLLVGHWVSQGGTKVPAKQVVEVKGLSGLAAAPAAASTTPASTTSTPAAKRQAERQGRSASREAKAEAKETKAEKAPPPKPVKVAPAKIKKLTDSERQTAPGRNQRARRAADRNGLTGWRSPTTAPARAAGSAMSSRRGGRPVGGLPAQPALSGSMAELRRRRYELAERVAELTWDLGGLTYEMAIRDHYRLDVLARRAAELQQADAQLGEVQRLLAERRGRRPRPVPLVRRRAQPRRLVLLALRRRPARGGAPDACSRAPASTV